MALARSRLLPACVLAVTLAVTGCGGGGNESARSPGAGEPGPSAGEGVRPQPQRFGITSHRADGNRLAAGGGAVPGGEPIETELTGAPSWLVAARPAGEDPVFAVAFSDGAVAGFELTDGRKLRPRPIAGRLAPGQPPLLDAERRELVQVEGGSPASAPTPFSGGFLAAGANGTILERGGRRPGRARTLAGVEALPDSRIAADSARSLVIGGRTDRYDHGVLGDAIEGSALFGIGEGDGVRPLAELEAPAVYEGAAPILADLGGSPEPEAIVTVSDPEEGARLVAYELEAGGVGASLASEPIGSGRRWRHQIAVAPFGPGGELELASVRTPHLDGTVEFHALVGDRLKLRATLEGYSSHQLGSANLDRAIAGDFDGSGRPELVLPTLDGSALAGVERTDEGAAEVWRLPLPAALTGNLAAVSDASGRLLLAAGTEDGRLMVWGAAPARSLETATTTTPARRRGPP